MTHKISPLALDCHPYPQPHLSVLATLRLGVRIIIEAVDNTRDAIFDERHLKVDEQAQTLVGEAKIRQQLFLVNWSEKFDGFHFHDHLVLDNHVGPKSSIDADVFINYRNRLLAHCPEAPASQLKCQNRIINGFEEAGTQRGVNAIGGVDDFLGDGVLSQTPPAKRVACWVGPPQRRLVYGFRRRAMRALRVDSELSACSIRRVLLADVCADLLQFEPDG